MKKDPNSPLFMCAPLNKLCTMCFMGNMNQYNECKKLEDKKIKDKRLIL